MTLAPTLAVQDITFTTPTLNAEGQVVAQRTLTARQFTQELPKGLSLDLIEVPAGAFLMGSRGNQGYDDERPQHRVTVAAFWMSKYPITQELWQLWMGKPTTRFPGAKRPVDNVAWKDAVKFCEKLAGHTGRAYRLPSEAQWEYACRANSTTAFAFGETLTTDQVNYNGDFKYGAGPKGVYRHVTLEVGQLVPNAFGLHDMHGNLWEWCADPWHDSYEGSTSDERVWTHKGQSPYRVARGGCWHDTPNECRSTARLKMPETEGDEFMGFRVVVASL